METADGRKGETASENGEMGNRLANDGIRFQNAPAHPVRFNSRWLLPKPLPRKLLTTLRVATVAHLFTLT